MILCHLTSQTPIRDLSFSDAGGVSSLGWLLDQYLEHRESARSCRAQAASFASQVRRLCRLLVHVEGPPGPSELSSQPGESSVAVGLRVCAVGYLAPSFSASLGLWNFVTFPGDKHRRTVAHSEIRVKLPRLPSVSTVSKNSKSQNGSPASALAPAPAPVCPSASLRNITQCWLSVVQGQVGRRKPGCQYRTQAVIPLHHFLLCHFRSADSWLQPGGPQTLCLVTVVSMSACRERAQSCSGLGQPSLWLCAVASLELCCSNPSSLLLM